MPHASSQALTDHFQVLFGAGTCAGLTDGELVERFRAGRDEGGERAFEALVTRHGPMVMGVCRNMLDDPADVHDAFQATFLVLARRAGAIRKTESVGSWLYGVAVRVAARARVVVDPAADPRPANDRGGRDGRGGRDRIAGHVLRSIGDEGAAIVHQEVDRLPEKYRAPIVLCYLEGLTHDEAAARLSWPVGTVRSRLSRARDRLRSRLTRRGVTAPSTLGPLAAWLIGDSAASTAAAAVASALPVHLSTSLARSATHFAIGQPAAAGSLSAVAMRLAQGVLTTMMLKKLAIAGCVDPVARSRWPWAVAPPGPSVPGPGTQAGPAAAPAQPTRPAAIADAPKPDDIDPCSSELLEAARKRVEAQRDYYEEGRITIDRFIDALAHLEKVQLIAARTDAERHGDPPAPREPAQGDREPREAETPGRQGDGVRRLGGPPASPGSGIRDEDQREGSGREVGDPPPLERARAQGGRDSAEAGPRSRPKARLNSHRLCGAGLRQRIG